MGSYFKILFATAVSILDGCLYLDISNAVIIVVKNVDYRCIIHKISKSEATDLLKNFVLDYRGYI